MTEETPYRATGWALTGLLLVLLGPVAYFLLLDFPILRASGAPAMGLIAAGAAAGVVAARRDARIWVRGLAVLNILLLLGSVWVLFGMLALPAPDGVTALTVAPDFTLPDHQGRAVSLSEAWAQGPVLLVFYRGFW